MENKEMNVDEVLEQPKETREECIQRKKSEREELSSRADAMVEQALSSPQLFATFLDKKHAFEKSSINTLLIMDQYPEATMVKSYDEWMQEDLPEDTRLNMRGVKKHMKGIKVFEKDGEYTRQDGSVGTSYKVAHVFDLSQTYGAPLPEKEPYEPHIKNLFRALTHRTKVPMRMSNAIDAIAMAEYKDGAVLITPKAPDGKSLFSKVAEEYIRAVCGRDGDEAAFVARSASFLVSKKFGIEYEKPERIPDSVHKMDISEKRELLSDIHIHASKTIERIQENMKKQKELEQAR